MRQSPTALVTGASRGIGKEIALELARNGYRVAVNYLGDPAEMVSQTLGEIRAAQPLIRDEVLCIEANIRHGKQVADMFERVMAAFGNLDLLINNPGGKTFKPLLEVTEEEWDWVIDINLKGCFLCTEQ